jgi:hypothetical protein
VGVAAARLQMEPWTGRRSTAMQAIQQRDYHILGERRPHARF